MGPGSKRGQEAKKWDTENPLLQPHKTLKPGLSEWEHRGRHNSLLFLSLRVERETDGEMDGAKTKSWKCLQNVIGTICVPRPRQTKHKTLQTDSGAFPLRLTDRSSPKDPPKTWNIKQDLLLVVLWANYVIRETPLKCLLRISYPSLLYTRRRRYMWHSQKVKSLQMTNVVYIVYLCPVVLIGWLQPIWCFWVHTDLYESRITAVRLILALHLFLCIAARSLSTLTLLFSLFSLTVV